MLNLFNFFYKTLPVHLSLLGVFLAFILYNFQVKIIIQFKNFSGLGKRLYNFLNRKWFFDKVYNEYLGQFFFKVGYSYTVTSLLTEGFLK
jgi:NADH-ubiquinone oxidoreductase chain 5